MLARQFDCKAVIHVHPQSLKLAKNELDLVILGNLLAGRSSSHLFPTQPDSPTTNSRMAIQYSYGGKRICRKMFSFVYAGHSLKI